MDGRRFGAEAPGPFRQIDLIWLRAREARDLAPVVELGRAQGSVHELAAADVDADGDYDLIAMVYDHLEIYENQSGTFSSGRVISIPGSGDLTQLLPADIDGDGDIDLVYTRTEDSIYWLENDNGLGNFANPVTIVSPVDPLVGITLLSADMDSDRDTDLVVASHVNAPLVPIVWLENRLVGDVNRDGRFSSNDLILVLQANEFEDDSSNNSSFEEGDWNGDGDFTRADLVVALQSGVYVTGPA